MDVIFHIESLIGLVESTCHRVTKPFSSVHNTGRIDPSRQHKNKTLMNGIDVRAK